MKYLFLILPFLVGCTDQTICEMVKGAHAFYGKNDVSCNKKGFDPHYERVQIVHDYIFENGRKACADHEGFHYVVHVTSVRGVGEREEYPCSETTKFRCQDGTLISFDTGIGACFISEIQLKESL